MTFSFAPFSRELSRSAGVSIGDFPTGLVFFSGSLERVEDMLNEDYLRDTWLEAGWEEGIDYLSETDDGLSVRA